MIAPTTVLDKDGLYVTVLKPMEFRLYDNDKPQTIKVDEVISPVSLVVAVQADYKVEAVLPKIQKIGTMLQTMVAGDGGEVAVVSFDHQIRMLQDFTSDPNISSHNRTPGRPPRHSDYSIFDSSLWGTQQPFWWRGTLCIILKYLTLYGSVRAGTILFSTHS